jgi:hypothetical protein
MFRRILCPYCFERFAPGEVPLRCTGFDNSQCPPVADEPLRRYHQQMTPRLMKPSFVPERSPLAWFSIPLNTRCPTCQTRTTVRLCPHCHNDLPEGYGRQRARVLALIGAKGAGKSVYIGALLRSLKNGALSEDFGTALRPLDEHTISKLRDIQRRLEEEEMTLHATRAGSTRSPMVFELRRRRSPGRWGFLSKWIARFRTPSVILSFFDTAGEDLDHIEATSVEARYISRSDGLIFLLDPLQMPSIRARMSDRDPATMPVASTDPVEIVARVVRLFRETGQMSGDKVGATVAVTISKVDEIRHLFESDSPVLRACHHGGYFDENDAARMHESIRAQLREYLGNDLPNELEAYMREYKFFAVSSLGASPEGGRLVRGAVPFRIEDPLLYILSRWGFIPSKSD